MTPINLPETFLQRMKSLPDFDFDSFLKSYDNPPFRGLRVNTLKCDTSRFAEISPFRLKKAPFSNDGFYIDGGVTGRHPWHHAGVFYFQEPSAMSAVTALDVHPGQKVLDLCAAPGGKSTQAAACLGGSGFILCNEIIPSRASVLLSNIERCGIRNAAVTCEKPEILCPRFAEYFDRVLVDAPCSGEGMFRREPAALREWSAQSPAACAKRQLGILTHAGKTVKAGGILVYSTCTFSPDENEGVIDAFLKENTEFCIEEINDKFGSAARPDWADANPFICAARRVFPFEGGEGHFVARLRKNSGGFSKNKKKELKPADKETTKLFLDFFASQFSEKLYGSLYFDGGKIFILPKELPDLKGINVLRAGVFAGYVKGRRFEPSHALFMAAKADFLRGAADFALDDSRLAAFLHGEQVDAPENCAKGYAGVKAHGFTVGFGKISDGTLKNHYPKGLRNL